MRILLVLVLSVASFAQTSIVAAEVNNVRYTNQFSNIQAAINNSGTSGSVIIDPSYAGTDTYTNPNGIVIEDLRRVKLQHFAFEGDSLTAGLGLLPGQDWPSQAMLLSFFKNQGSKFNDAVSGSTIANVVARYNANIKPLCQLSASGVLPQTWLFLLIGINDIGGGANGVTTGTSIANYMTTAKADGCKVVSFLQYQTVVETAAQVAQLHNMNLVLRQSTASWDYMVDLDRPISNSADAVLFQGDFVHPSAQGAVQIAKLVNSAMTSQGGFETITVGSPTGTYNLAGGLGETIGIGTQTPLNTLDVWWPSANLAIATNEGTVSVTNSDTTVGNLSALLFRNRAASAAVPTGRIAMEATSSGSFMHFQGSNNYATGITTDIAIADGQHGRFGVGGYPTQVLDVFGAARIQGALTGTTSIAVGGDAAFSSSPRMLWAPFASGDIGVLNDVYAQMTMDRAITITRVQVVLQTAAATCATSAVLRVGDGTNNVDLTLTDTNFAFDSGPVTVNIPAAAVLQLKVPTAPAGCGTNPADGGVTVQYRMQ